MRGGLKPALHTDRTPLQGGLKPAPTAQECGGHERLDAAEHLRIVDSRAAVPSLAVTNTDAM